MRPAYITLLALAPALLLAAAPRAAAQDAKAGETTFKRFCAVCHSVVPGQNRVGPSLYGIVGRKAGSAPGYSYSEANKNSGITWTEDELEKYLANPQQVVPHTKMLFTGLKNPEDRKNVIAYLKQVGEEKK
jgi:cytochrome c